LIIGLKIIKKLNLAPKLANFWIKVEPLQMMKWKLIHFGNSYRGWIGSFFGALVDKGDSLWNISIIEINK
jgi:hypothetical protein